MKEIKDSIKNKATTEINKQKKTSQSQYLRKHKSINLQSEYGNKIYVIKDCD